MEVLLRVFKTCSAMFKRNQIVTLCSFILINSFADAHTTCPALTINAICLNGAWQVSITPQNPHWELMGEGVNGQPCNNGAQTNDVRWNYAYYAARMGEVVGCNYSLFDNAFSKIGLIQLKSNEFVPIGSNWQRDSYPGNLICKAAQETCLFSER